MPRFAANLSMLFCELPYEDRFAAAARAGFPAVEILYPYDRPPEQTRALLRANSLPLVLINAPPPAPDGSAGFAAIPGGERQFARRFERVVQFAGQIATGPQFIHVMSGVAEGPDAHRVLVRNLQAAADRAPHLRLTLEPLNPRSQPGYFLNDYDLAAEVIDQIARPNVGLQFDSFHAQMIHGDAQAVWERHRARIIHAQIGDAPDRSEPGSGTIDFAELFASMDAGGYDGWVSAEYRPSTAATEPSLGWMRAIP